MRADPSLERSEDSDALEACLWSSQSSLIMEPPLPDFSAFHASFSARALHQAFLAFSAASFANFRNCWYSCTKASRLSRHSQLRTLSQASHFFLDRFFNSSVTQSASTLLGASGKDLVASCKASLKEFHVKFTSDDSA